MENPCKRDCPRRSPTCHSSCPDYAKYKRYLKRKKAAIEKVNVYDKYISIKKDETYTTKLKENRR